MGIARQVTVRKANIQASMVFAEKQIVLQVMRIIAAIVCHPAKRAMAGTKLATAFRRTRAAPLALRGSRANAYQTVRLATIKIRVRDNAARHREAARLGRSWSGGVALRHANDQWCAMLRGVACRPVVRRARSVSMASACRAASRRWYVMLRTAARAHREPIWSAGAVCRAAARV